MATLAKRYGFLGGLALLALLVGLATTNWDYDFAGYVVVALALVLVTVFFVIPRTARGETRLLWGFLIVAFLLKAGASLYRIYWNVDVKSGKGDSSRYDATGRALAERIWHFDFSTLTPLLTPGTTFVEAVTGVVYAFIGPTLFGGFLFFAFLVFVASCIWYRAFRRAFPEGNRLIYAGLIFLYPSWLYWPSSIGKDALLALMIAIVGYGTLGFLRRPGLGSILLMALGLGGVFMVRPHVAALIAVAMGVAIMTRSYRLGAMSGVVRIALIGIAALVGWAILNQASAYIGLEEISLDAALAEYEVIQNRASGGSRFEPVNITDPTGIPMAVLTILYRPFPWEAHRGAALVLSFEGVFLLGLTVWRFRSIKAAIMKAGSDPFVLFILAYVAIFILVFTSFGNFSILGRQRLQMLPLFFMLLAYPAKTEAIKQAAKKRGRKKVALPSGA